MDRNRVLVFSRWGLFLWLWPAIRNGYRVRTRAPVHPDHVVFKDSMGAGTVAPAWAVSRLKGYVERIVPDAPSSAIEKNYKANRIAVYYARS